MIKFSQRIGEIELIKPLQFESIDNDLKNGLWNLVIFYVLNNLKNEYFYYKEKDLRFFCQDLWHNFYKLPVDTIPSHNIMAEKFIRDKFFNGKWFEAYDLIEYLAKLDLGSFISQTFIQSVNRLLEQEFSAYRFIDGLISPISNKIEIEELEVAILQTYQFTSLNGANIHLTSALEKLSDKKNPDYRNSIKESISAVEAICRKLTGESTLGKALNALESKGILIDEQIKNGFDKIYASTNNKQSGIRHAIIEKHKNPDFDDAKFMLVICSSFINLLIGKCRTSGITIK